MGTVSKITSLKILESGPLDNKEKEVLENLLASDLPTEEVKEYIRKVIAVRSTLSE